LVGGGESDGRVGLGNVGVEWCVHARVAARRSRGWGDKLRGLGWGFYRREGEDGSLGLSCWGGHDQGAKPEARRPSFRWRCSPWRQQHPRQKNASTWRLPKGEGEILWASEESLAGPHGRAGSAAPWCTGQLVCW
jgi:hypothetical protein